MQRYAFSVFTARGAAFVCENTMPTMPTTGPLQCASPPSPCVGCRSRAPPRCAARGRVSAADGYVFVCILPCVLFLCLFAVGDFEAEDISSQLMERQPEAKEVLLSDDEFEDENGE